MNKKQLLIFSAALIIVIVFVAIGFRTSSTPAPVEVTPTDPTSVEETAWLSEEIDEVEINEETSTYEIHTAYPQTKSDAVTLTLKTFVQDSIDQFKEDTSWVTDEVNTSDQLITLDITYESYQADTVHTYIFTTNSYTGGAHGLQARKTFSYDAKGQLITIASLFKNGLDDLPLFSKLVQAELKKKNGFDTSWSLDGAAPDEANYASFVVTDGGVKILFDPYQVAPYSYGAVDVTIAKSAFAKIADPTIFIQ